MNPTKPAKDEVREMLERLPEDATLEDIQYHIFVRQKIEHGIAAAEEGRLVDEEAAERRFSRWLGE